MKFYEVQKYITNLRYLFLLEPIIVSEGVFQEQSEDVQKAILEAGVAATKFSAEYLADTEAKPEGRPDRQGHADRRSGQR